MTKELATTMPKGLITSEGPVKGAADSIDASDISISKILLMQALSPPVVDEKCKIGDFMDSASEQIIGHKDKKPLELFVLDSYKTLQTWVNKEWASTQSFEPKHLNNPDFPNDPDLDTRYKPVKNWWVMRPQDLATGGFPKVLSMKGSSMKASKDLAADIMQLRGAGAPSWARVYTFTSFNDEYEKHKFQSWKVTGSRAATAEEYAACEKWFDTLAGEMGDQYTEKANEADEVAEAKSTEATPEPTGKKVAF